MAATTARNDVFTYDDFCVRVKDGDKADLIDGVIYMASPDNIDAARLNSWLSTVMNVYARRKQIGEVFGSRVACRLDKMNAPEPDLLFVRRRNMRRVKRGGIHGRPDLALEIVSPSSVERDYVKKLQQYEHFRIPEYWIIDELEQKVFVFRLDRNGKYQESRPRKGIFTSQVMAGFWLDPSWLWQKPLPDELGILQKLLAE